MCIPLLAVEVGRNLIMNMTSANNSADFGFNTTYADLTADGSCTACEVTQDHSAYWAPTMNFNISQWYYCDGSAGRRHACVSDRKGWSWERRS